MRGRLPIGSGSSEKRSRTDDDAHDLDTRTTKP